MNNRTIILIPSRIGSTRLPKKPLINISGMSLIQRVFTNVDSLKLDTYIATDSNEIFEHVLKFTKNVVMTDSKHISGTDRVFEAATKLNINDDDLVINLQGDEPFMPVQIINQLPMLLSIDTPISTACIKFSNKMDFNSPHEVKVVRSISKKAMYFSRAVIPNAFTAENKNYLKHLGIYAYTNVTLQALSKLKPTANEELEKLEQLRFLDNGFNIIVEDFEYEAPIGIDTPEDLEAATIFAKQND